MTVSGFYLRRLEARGRDKATASIEFAPGLNVISGASDTGKSYLVECIDFMLGRRDPPKTFDESQGYESLWLEIQTWDGQPFSLERSLRGGDFNRYEVRLDEIGEETPVTVLKRVHGANGQSASEFFLTLSQMQGIRIRTNKAGKTRGLSFRDVAHMVLVEEEQIYTSGSPIHPSGQATERTAESSFFRYLLTGVDDSSVISKEPDSDLRARRQAQLEAVDGLIAESETVVLQLTDAPDEIVGQLSRLNSTLTSMTTTIALDRERLRDQQSQRQQLWGRVQRRAARQEVLSRLQNRFLLLDEHYSTDLARLAAVVEAADLLQEFPEVQCPICGSIGLLSGSSEPDHGANINAITHAARGEIRKIQAMRDDLSATIVDLSTETQELGRQNSRDTRSYERVLQLIETELQPAEGVNQTELNQLLEIRGRLEKAQGMLEQMKILRDQRDRLLTTLEPAERPSKSAADSGTPKTSESSDFCEVVEAILRDWSFPDYGRVTFSEENEDIVIAGQDRKSHGKGIRALAYAAFILSLLRYCRQEQRPHPGLVVLDSPLVAYREPDIVEKVQQLDVKGAFFRSLSSWTDSMQVIVFENEDPPKELEDRIKFVHFAKRTTDGKRYGFFPINGGEPDESDGNS